MSTDRITYVGHATALIELDGVRVLTDPVFRPRLLKVIVRQHPEPDPGIAERIDAVAARLGGLDNVIVTAGVLRIGRVDLTTPADLAEVIDVNLTGSLNVARAAYPHLRPSSGSLTVCRACWYSTTRCPWWACQAESPCTKGVTTERRACLICRNTTSSALLPSSRATYARSPTLPTPTTLCATSTKV